MGIHSVKQLNEHMRNLAQSERYHHYQALFAIKQQDHNAWLDHMHALIRCKNELTACFAAKRLLFFCHDVGLV